MNQHGITHTARLKTHADGSVEVLAASRPVFREPGWEERGRGGRKVAPGPAATAVEAVELSVWDLERMEDQARQRDSDSLARSKRRARTSVRDYALNTPFRYFVTLTLDGARVDRYDPAAVTRALNVWCDNQVRRKGLAYVLVAELHKDGAIHFHGFFNDALPVVDSGTMVPPGGGKPKRPRSAAQRAAWAAQGGRTVYNPVLVPGLYHGPGAVRRPPRRRGLCLQVYHQGPGQGRGPVVLLWGGPGPPGGPDIGPQCGGPGGGPQGPGLHRRQPARGPVRHPDCEGR